jgi:uncharacterized protein YutE (UPF0331/DUF86 family)
VVDIAIIQKKISAIAEQLNFLQARKSTIVKKNLNDDIGLLNSVAYAIHAIIQASIDIATHIASDENWELPSHSAQSFKILERHEVISNEISEDLQQAVKLRNVIVHQYDDLHLDVIENVVKTKLDYFLKFTKEIQSWLKNRGIK